jgi:ABC-type molybdenum transport system ATPase subunit/photorepair protein PhrA
MSALSELVAARPRFAKSANVERDAESAAPLDGYILTPRAGEVLERVLTAIGRETGGAWSIVGPYGSGKSSLALLLDAVLHEESTPTGIVGLELLKEQQPSLATLRRMFGSVARGFVTAGNESLAHTVLRAVRSAAISHYGKVPTARQLPGAQILAEQDSGLTGMASPSPTAIVALVRALAERVPVVLLIDEFGKNVESAIERGNSNDPYLLQQLAELGQGSKPLPVYLVTLQHLSFEDYLSGSSTTKEWAKVQGRFEDVAFVEAPSQTRSLIASVFDADPALRTRVEKWAKQKAEVCAVIGLPDLADPNLLGSCYPLHPLAVAVLPELCSRYGQNERTLFSFLAGTSAFAVPSLLGEIAVQKGSPLPTIGLGAVFDFFVGAQATAQLAGPFAARWLEIATRFRDVQGLSKAEQDDLKSIAVLNLVSAGGSLRASRRLLESVGVTTLDSLRTRGLVTWRDFSDEFRIWQGTDFDLGAAVARAKALVETESVATLLSRNAALAPMIAARHSSEHETVRVFERSYVDGRTAPPPAPSAHQPVDGLLLYWVDSDEATAESLVYGVDDKPVVLAEPEIRTHLRDAAIEVAALNVVRSDDRVEADWVAQREVAERLAIATSELLARIDSAFNPREGCSFTMRNGIPSRLRGGRGSAAISEASDVAFSQTPRIANEVLNRHEPSSQGARARRELLEAMINSMELEDLGLEGFGPEKAMYLAVLKASGIHRRDMNAETFTIGAPYEASPLRPAWDKIADAFTAARTKRLNLNSLYGELQARPFGMKAGAIPVLVTAVLLATRDEVAVYEHGTFKPLLGADVSERMVRNPQHFDVKHFAAHSGLRSDLVDAYAAALNIGPAGGRQRVSRVLRVVSHLVARMNSLTDYAKRTMSLDAATLAVRSALAAAVEPDVLLFESIPVALGYPQIGPKSRLQLDPHEIASQLAVCLDTLDQAFPNLIHRIADGVLEESAAKTKLSLAGQAEEVSGVALRADIRALAHAFKAAVTMEHLNWAEYVGNVVNDKQPSVWTDDDERRFGHELRERCEQFRRISHLSTAMAAETNEGFSVKRVVFTGTDGTEDARIASLDDVYLDEVSALVDETLGRLEIIVGSPSKARDALLVVLGDRLTARVEQSETVIPLRDTRPPAITRTRRRPSNA